MKVRVIASLVMALCLAVTANASTIGVYTDLGATDCDNVIPVGPTTWYICAKLYGDVAAAGMTGAEFRQDGTPPSYFMSANANPAAPTNVGNPLTPGGLGCNIAFPSCQPGPVVLLYTVSGFASAVVPLTYLTIDRHTNPSNPNFQCPLVTLCDPPVFTKLCVPGGQFVINGPCTIGVEPATWTAVKGLYNN